MDDALLDVVVQRLEGSPLPDEASDLLLAALDGDDALGAQLEAAPAQRYVPEESTETGPAPVGAYLQSLTVSGFLGIGP